MTLSTSSQAVAFVLSACSLCYGSEPACWLPNNQLLHSSSSSSSLSLCLVSSSAALACQAYIWKSWLKWLGSCHSLQFPSLMFARPVFHASGSFFYLQSHHQIACIGASVCSSRSLCALGQQSPGTGVKLAPMRFLVGLSRKLGVPAKATVLPHNWQKACP